MSDDGADKTDDVKERLEDGETVGAKTDDSDVVATLDGEDE
jgi:hypothetical protein